MKNLKEFKELIKKYESITLEDVQIFKADSEGVSTANILTGFGAISTCTLCIKVYSDCVECTWTHLTHAECMDDCNKETYWNISEAETDKQLLGAFKARAYYMRKALRDNDIKFEKE